MSSIRRSSSAAMRAFSCASRVGYCFGSRKSVSMPCARAMSRTGAAPRSEISTAMITGSRPDSAASTRAWKFEPLPEARTPTRSRSAIHHRAGAGTDLTDVEDSLPRRRQDLRRARRVAGTHDEEKTQAHVEGASHLGVLDPPRLLHDPEYGGHG